MRNFTRNPRQANYLFVLFLLALPAEVRLYAAEPAVRSDRQGNLNYTADARGNRIPDFSHCGYRSSEGELPSQVPVKVVVTPAEGEDDSRIQAAIDYVATLPLEENGFRGAIRLAPGEFHIAGQLSIRASGIVLQGSGATEDGTTLVATGQDRRALIRVRGAGEFPSENSLQVTDDYVPVGATAVTVDSPSGFFVGAGIIITRPSSQEWVELLGARVLGVGWRPGSRDLHWERTVTEIDGNTIHFDAPITTAIDKRYGGATMQQYRWPGRLQQVGIDDLRLISEYDSENPKDEDHAWFGVLIEKTENAWVRGVVFRHFAGGAVHLGRHTKLITVEDCVAQEPISEVGGYRRHTFFTLGQLTLFHRCWSERGRHDFSTGHCSAGPNAFVQCYAFQALDASGPIESWSSGVLYDNVRIDGHNLQLQNRWASPPGAGWAAANSVLWQCRAANAQCFNPPEAANWAIGVWATPAGDGNIESISDFVNPLSLFQAQLEERHGRDAARRFEPELGRPRGATSPSYAEAEEFLRMSEEPARQLIDVISEKLQERTGSLQRQWEEELQRDDLQLANVAGEQLEKNSQGKPTRKPVRLKNGWLVVGAQLKAGDRLVPSWWRGTVRAEEAVKFGHNITRFAPGRHGPGRTDELRDVVDTMLSNNQAAYEHHYGLWYDRRRDDHLMVRRADGNVAPPFYEQPFARTGEGTAWDGLSRYDLTRYNPWYWNRLRRFADLAEQRGLLLIHQDYFQHNILEAGAHWADSPWRPVNNINDVELPEPPPYIGDKRLFMAQHFYDLSNENLRQLHRQYIRQCLEAFADRRNVIHMTSAEYTGPLEFVEFWLDTIIEWEEETGHDALVALSCTKDVQDAILADEQRADAVEIIDIRYWTYDKNFDLYAPEGGKYLAPRQHMRQLGSKESSFASVVHAVREYRQKHPDKAVIYSAAQNTRSGNPGWAVLIGGGSLPGVKLPEELAKIVPTMQPDRDAENPSNQWSLTSPEGDERLIYCHDRADQLELNSLEDSARYKARWIEESTGEVRQTEEILIEAATQVAPKTRALWLTRIP